MLAPRHAPPAAYLAVVAVRHTDVAPGEAEVAIAEVARAAGVGSVMPTSASPVAPPRRRPIRPDLPLIADHEVVIAPGHADPRGLRVVPYRPDAAWPEGRRVHPRLRDPFRPFPGRSHALRALIIGVRQGG